MLSSKVRWARGSSVNMFLNAVCFLFFLRSATTIMKRTHNIHTATIAMKMAMEIGNHYLGDIATFCAIDRVGERLDT